MKKLSYTLLLLLIAFYGEAATDITGTWVTGHWTLAGSPYNVLTNISIPGDKTLIIDPGVQVNFSNGCSIHVYGSIYSVGTAAQPINFTVADTTGWATDTQAHVGWYGLYIEANSHPNADSLKFSYTNFSYMSCRSSVIPANFYSTNRGFSFDHCNFVDTRHYLFNIYLGSANFEMAYCNLERNDNDFAHANIISSGTAHIHHNRFHDNLSGTTLLYFPLHLNLTFDNNVVYNNVMRDTSLSPVIEMEGCKGLVQDNIIYNNTSVFTAPLSCDHSELDINRNYICNNKTLVGNRGGIICEATQSGGGIRLNGLNTTTQSYLVRNNLIANNFSAAVVVQ